MPALSPDISALVLDIGREMRDTAPRSTLTRVARMIDKSDIAVDMAYQAVLAARAVTRRRLSRVRNRARNGQVAAMPYLLACLARALGVVPVREVATDAPTCPVVPRSVVGGGTVPACVIVPVVRQDAEREQFWQVVSEACGISPQTGTGSPERPRFVVGTASLGKDVP